MKPTLIFLILFEFAFVCVNAKSIFVQSRYFSDSELDVSFGVMFKTNFNKTYAMLAEDSYGRLVFASNLEFIVRHNELYRAGNRSFSLGINQFADLTHEEFLALYTGLQPSIQPHKPQPEIRLNEGELLSQAVDWTKSNAVTEVQHQGKCASGWAYAAVGAIEGQVALGTGNLTKLKLEQNLVQCSGDFGNAGCYGGMIDNAYQYLLNPAATNCTIPAKPIITDYFQVHPPYGNGLMRAVAKLGPIAVAIDGSARSFQFYTSGVYDESACSTNQLNHALLLVGYGQDEKWSRYWKLKNSFGTGWGEDGFMRLTSIKNQQCGVATMAFYPKFR